MPPSLSLRAKSFVWVGRVCARLPRFRGRNRALLALFRGLGLAGAHVFVDAELAEPTPYRARLDLHSWLQRIAFLDSGYEPQSVRFLLRLHALSGGEGALVDIGANIGLIAVPAALMLAERGVARPCVCAIEAVSDNAAALRETVARNDAGALVEVIEAALGDNARAVEVQVEGDLKHGGGTGTANILADASDYFCERIPLHLTTLDTLMSEGRLPARCVIVKLDTDGYDLMILRGATAFLSAHRPIIFGEFAAHCLAWHGQTLANVDAFAKAINYDVWRRTGTGWRFASDDPAPFVQDLLLAPGEKAHLLAPVLTEGADQAALTSRSSAPAP